MWNLKYGKTGYQNIGYQAPTDITSSLKRPRSHWVRRSMEQKQPYRCREEIRGCQPGTGAREVRTRSLGLLDAKYYIQDT